MLVSEHTLVFISVSVDAALPDTANTHFAQAMAPEHIHKY